MKPTAVGYELRQGARRLRMIRTLRVRFRWYRMRAQTEETRPPCHSERDNEAIKTALRSDSRGA